MGTSPLGGKLCRRIAADVGQPIKRAVGYGGYDFGFVTFDHAHGTWSKVTGEVSWDPDPLHWSSCRWNFPHDEEVRDVMPQHLCGARDNALGGDLFLLCAELADHDGRHRCGSESWD